MLKAITLLKRKQDLSSTEFEDYWLNKHTEVIRELPGIQRYVQNHPLKECYEKEDPAFDGIAELWAEDTGAFRDIAASEAYQAVLDDEKRFIDHISMELILTSEHVLLDGPVPTRGIKQIRLIQHKPGMEIEKFQQYWHTVHGRELLKLPHLKRYVQSHARPGGYAHDRSPAYDVMSSLWFDTMSDLNRAMNSPLYADIMEADKKFSNQDELLSVACIERIIIN